MSPNVGNFVHDLVEMAKAMETLPQVEHALRQTEEQNRHLSETVQAREEAILKYKAEIEALQAKVRTTEAERDDAEIRFLELDEKANKVLAHVASIQAAALVVQNDLSPPKPEPQPEPKPEPVYTGAAEGWQPSATAMAGASNEPGANLAHGSGQGESHPTVNATAPVAETNSAPAPVTTMENVPTSQGESVAPPTAPPSPTPISASTDPAPMPVAGSTGEDGGVGKYGPYSGKRYYDHPTYVSRMDWLAGGGTEADYDWRPPYNQTAGAGA